MTREDFIEQALNKVRFTYERSFNRQDMKSALSALCDVAAAELLKGGEIPLPGIGKLKMKERAARTCRNPRTGEAIEVLPSRKVVFAPCKDFRESCRA